MLAPIEVQNNQRGGAELVDWYASCGRIRQCALEICWAVVFNGCTTIVEPSYTERQLSKGSDVCRCFQSMVRFENEITTKEADD